MQSALGTIADLIEYFNINKHIFEKQKNNKEHMERIMAMLTQQNMKILQKQFQLYTKGLQLPTFIYLMKKLYIPQDQLSKYYFVSDLIKFFQAIDVNGDGHLQWSQFTEYIIQNIRRVQKPNYKNKSFQQNEIISSAYSKISNQYKITKVIDTGASNCIKKIIYLSKQQKYYVLEAGSNQIKIFDSNFNKIDFFALKGKNKTAFIVDFSYDQQNQIFCALFEGSARFCNIKLAGTIKFMNQVQQKKLQNYHKVQYLPRHNLWSFLSKCGQIKYSRVSYKSRTQMTYVCQTTFKQHDGMVTDIVQIQEPKYVLTSSMDGTIKLFSLMLKKSLVFQHISQQTHSIINNKNKKGILGVDYTRQFGSYILSYGFSTKIYIYSLDISLTKGYTGKYSQHSGNLIAAKFLKCYPYALSFDDKLNLRIWDFRTFQTIQIINCQKNFINPSRLQIIPQLSQCLICQKKITQFRAPSLQKKSKQINEFYNIFQFKICSMTNNIFVFTSNDVRVYNYITGALMHVFTKLDQNSFETNITAAQFGYKSRKFFLGDAAGYVRQFDSQTGEFLQEVKPSEDIQYQNKAIVKIIFLKQHSLLVVCSLDGRIMIYERDSESQFQIIRDIRQSHEQLTCAAASVRYCLLATGSQNGTVNIWNLQKFSLQSVLIVQNKIVNIAFSPIHPVMMVVQQTGCINFFYVRPFQNSQLRYKCFLKVQNRDEFGNIQPISSFSFDLIITAYFNKKCSLIQGIAPSKHHFIVTIGQKNGQIIQANLNQIIQKFKIQENHQIFSTKKSMRCQIQNAKTLVSNQRNKILSLQGYSNQNVQIMKITDFKNRKKFQAHNQKIDQLLLIKQNSIILTTSSDKKLKVWSFQGQMNGSIDFFTFKKIHWKVSQINFHKKIQAIQTCIYAIKLIENRKFTPLEEEEIKINLLMNQFMDQKQKVQYINWIKVVRRNRNPKIRTRAIHSLKTSNKNSGSHKMINKNPDESTSQDQQLLQEYFRGIRLQQLQQGNNQGQQNKFQCESISNTQFDQIYKKLITKIKKKIQHDNQQSLQLPVIDLSKILQSKIKPVKHEHHDEIDNNSRIHHKKMEEFQQKFQSKLFSNLNNVTLKQDRLLNNKQVAQYDKLFNKTLKIDKQNNKGKYKSKPKNNILYHNLTQVRRKIDIMNKIINKSPQKIPNQSIFPMPVKVKKNFIIENINNVVKQGKQGKQVKQLNQLKQLKQVQFKKQLNFIKKKTQRLQHI